MIMENANKQKPVPDVPELKYRGTADNPDIKIFVSHRIDLDSEIIDNSIFVPVRCGAVYDERENVTMLGDDTGNNISEKRMSFCELTIQYWAWKNVEADYYGLCHYRRYLSFSNLNFPVANEERNNGCISEKYINEDFVRQYNLNEKDMRNVIEKYDVIACNPIKANKNNYQCMKDSPDYHNIEDMDKALEIIKNKYPAISKIADEYMNSKNVRLYNCFIMKKDIFYDYCSWCFDILFSLENEIDTYGYSVKKYRTMGTIGERLFGIYCLYLKKNRKIKFRENQLIFIEHTEKQDNLFPYFGYEQITYVSNFNNKYVPIFACSLLSMIEHISAQKKYEFIILSDDITTENKNILKEMCSKYQNIKITFYDPYSHFSSTDIQINNGYYSKDLFVRPIIPYVLANYKKCLVIDADTIIKDDIGNLYEQNLAGYTIAAVRDCVFSGWVNMDFDGTREYVENVLKLRELYNYCNTGVLIIDCDAYRNKYSLKYIMEMIRSQNFKIYEQDMINVLFQDDILYLPPEWNLFSYSNKVIKESIDSSPIEQYNAYKNARAQPKIIHYANVPKPWNAPICDFAEDWWHYARQTPFYEEILYRMDFEIANLEMRNRIDRLEKITGINFLRKAKNFLKRKLPSESPMGKIARKIYHKIRQR